MISALTDEIETELSSLVLVPVAAVTTISDSVSPAAASAGAGSAANAGAAIAVARVSAVTEMHARRVDLRIQFLPFPIRVD